MLPKNALPKYEITTEIALGFKTVIYRGFRNQDNLPVIVKLPSSEYPTIEEITRIKQEYLITKSLNSKGIIKTYGLEKYKSSFALILEDVVGKSMKDILDSYNIHLREMLSIAISLTDTLGELNQAGIIHKDIKPSNIIINYDTGQVKLTDFGIASRLSQENLNPENLNILEGTLAYMSPEQTGRMNRGIDYRTDYYAFGATLYEMLVGRVPFKAKEPMELVHCHLAIEPDPPHEIKPEIPEALSAIVLKLLAKDVRDRYQSAAGLKYDLEKCLDLLSKEGRIDYFLPGDRDRTTELLIPQKLYGRETEVQNLLDAFDRVSGVKLAGEVGGERQNSQNPQAEMILVAGYSGIGKTAIVKEVQKPIVRQRGHFISGKFDQFKRNIPYAAIIQAFTDMTRHLLTETNENLAIWKQKIADAVCPNGRVIIDVIPEVKIIIGPQPEAVELGPTESENRFHLVFQKFIRVFTEKDHPLVLFLDDLQWADSASLKFINLLMSDPNSKYLLLIGAYRDNEVSPTHPLVQTIEKIQRAGAVLNKLTIRPLEIDHVSQLITETLGKEQLESSENQNQIAGGVEHISPQLKTQSLAELIFQKTQGNPFFLTQLLKTLYSEKLLAYDVENDAWKWDMKEIQAVGIIDYSVVELICRNIQKLSASTQDVVKLASCIGNQFNLEVLAIANQELQTVTAAKLWEALQAGLILPTSNNYKIPLIFDSGEAMPADVADITVNYRFLHDRVQQAAYSLIPPEEKKQTHLIIGQLLLENTTVEERKENIFALVNQLNYGTDLLVKQQEKDDLAALNLVAGQKAKASTAYEAAVNYLNIGLGLLHADGWQSNYDLVMAVHLEALEAEYLNSNFERSNLLAEVALAKVKTLLEKVNIYELQIKSLIARNQMLEAIELAQKVLEMLGVSIDKEPPKIIKMEELADLTDLTQPDKLAALRILHNISNAAFVTNPELMAQFTFTRVNFCIKYGNSAIAAITYIDYGLILCAIMKDIETGYRLGKLGVMLLERFDAKELKSIALMSFNSNVRHWKEHLKETLESLLEAFQCGQETGELVYSGYAALVYCTNLFFTAEDLKEVDAEHVKYLDLLQKLKLEYHVCYGQIGRQLIFNLLGRSENKFQLKGMAFNESEMLPILIENNIGTALVYAYMAKAMLCYLFKEPELAIAAARECQKYEQAATGLITVAQNNFYYSLALLAVYPNVDEEQQREYISQVEINQEKMKLWAKHAPMNFQHKYDLVEAERLRALGKYSAAVNYYDIAIDKAIEQNYTQDEALAYELAGEFYLDRHRGTLASFHVIESYYAYVRWGAWAKIEDLEQRYPQFMEEMKAHQREEVDVQRTMVANTTKSGSLELLDIPALMKAAQIVAGEIVLNELVKKLMEIAIKNAGAETGCLILDRDRFFSCFKKISAASKKPREEGKLGIAISGKVEGNKVVMDRSPSLEILSVLPMTVIKSAQRSRQCVVLRDAKNDSEFNHDPYIIQSQTLSLLCMPIVSRGELIGLLYLENNWMVSAFTNERVELLSILSSQAAISLENASLYSDLQDANEELKITNIELKSAKKKLEENNASLEEKVRERTKELQEKNQQISEALKELKRSQAQIIQTEKMSSLGRMVAGIAHEINNPINFIFGNISYTQEYMEDLLRLIALYMHYYPNPDPEILGEIEGIDLEFLKEDLPELLGSMKKGSDRIRNIVLSLRNFSRLDESELKEVDIHVGIDSTLLIVQHRLGSIVDFEECKNNQEEQLSTLKKGIQVIKKYGNLPKVECYSGDLNQVFMNILSNAIDALEQAKVESEKSNPSDSNPSSFPCLIPTIWITTFVVDSKWIGISIKDNGQGIADTVRERLFDPFFTTKPVGSGTGLGLSVCYSIIVKKHGGKINCVSELGKGAEFIIKIPIAQAKQQKKVGDR